MTPIEMATAAAQAMRDGTGLTLTIPKGRYLRTFPRGELLNEARRNGVVERTYRFDPERVLEWLVKNGLVEAEIQGEELVIREVPAEEMGT